MPPRRRTVDEVIDHLAANSVLTDIGCIEWTGTANRAGYGTFGWSPTADSKAIRGAHRIAYHVLVEPVPPVGHEIQIDHLCRNRLCVNPDHLEAVTAWENTHRTDGPSSRNTRKTHCLRGHPYDEVNTGWKKTGTRRPFRVCRTCARASFNAYSARRRAERAS